MNEVTGYWVRGAKVHADPQCARTAKPVTLDGPWFPTRPDGSRDTWHPCHQCGLPLVGSLVARTDEQTVPWLVATYPVGQFTPSWQLDRRRRLADMILGFSTYTLVTVTRDDLSDPPPETPPPLDPLPEGRFAAVVALPVSAGIVLDPLLQMVPLPRRVLTDAVDDPDRFAATCEVFDRITGSSIPTLLDPGDPLSELTAWAEAHWAAAEAIMTPVPG